jgi:hypothetical protein
MSGISSVGLGYGLDSPDLMIPFQRAEEAFLFFQSSRQSLGPIYHRTEWVAGGLSTRVKRSGH